MRNFHPFYAIGTIGILIIASLHIVLSLFVIESPNHVAFLGVYPAFMVFLILGIILTIKQQKTAKEQG